MEVPCVAVACFAFQLQGGKSFTEDPEGSLELKAGEGSPDAEVDAGAEADVRVGAARGVEDVGQGKLLLVAIGRTEEETDLVAAPQFDPAILDVLQSVALEHMQRGVEAEHFLGAGGRRGEERGRARAGKESLHTVADRVDSGFVAGIKEKNGRGR